MLNNYTCMEDRDPLPVLVSAGREGEEEKVDVCLTVEFPNLHSSLNIQPRITLILHH